MPRSRVLRAVVPFWIAWDCTNVRSMSTGPQKTGKLAENHQTFQDYPGSMHQVIALIMEATLGEPKYVCVWTHVCVCVCVFNYFAGLWYLSDRKEVWLLSVDSLRQLSYQINTYSTHKFTVTHTQTLTQGENPLWCWEDKTWPHHTLPPLW